MPDKYFKCHYCDFKVPNFQARKTKGTGTAGPDTQWAKLSSHVLGRHGIDTSDDYHDLETEDFIDMESKAAERDGWGW